MTASAAGRPLRRRSIARFTAATPFQLLVSFLLLIAATASLPTGALPVDHSKATAFACTAPPESSPALAQQSVSVPQTISDDLGRPFTLPGATPERIVSMAPNITEILFALGIGGRVVGVTRFCDYPPEAMAIRKIGGLVDPNIEIIESLRPELVLAFRGNPLRVLDRLGDLKLPVFILDIGGGMDTVLSLITKIGLVTRREKEAAGLNGRLRARLSALERRLAGISDRPRVFILLYSQGLWTAGGQGYITDLVGKAGALNIAAGVAKKWVLYSRERIIHDNPDAVFVMAKSMEAFAEARAWLSGAARLESIAAVKSGRVYHLDENAASRFGPRLVDVAEEMARDLHPERFGGTR